MILTRERLNMLILKYGKQAKLIDVIKREVQLNEQGNNFR